MSVYRTIIITAVCLLSACASPPKAPMPAGGERAPANDPAQIRQFLIESEEVQRLSEENAQLQRVLMQSKGQVLDMKRYVLGLQDERAKPKVRAVKQETVISDGKLFKKKMKTTTVEKQKQSIVAPASLKPEKHKTTSKPRVKTGNAEQAEQAVNVNSSAAADAPSKVKIKIEKRIKGSSISTNLVSEAIAKEESKSVVSKSSGAVEEKNSSAVTPSPSKAKPQRVATSIKKDSTTYTFYHDIEDTSFIPSNRINSKMLRDASNARKILVIGGADSRSATTQNKMVAKQREMNAKRYLVEHGVDQSLIELSHLSAGENLSSLGLQKRDDNNRRVEITMFN